MRFVYTCVQYGCTENGTLRFVFSRWRIVCACSAQHRQSCDRLFDVYIYIYIYSKGYWQPCKNSPSKPVIRTPGASTCRNVLINRLFNIIGITWNDFVESSATTFCYHYVNKLCIKVFPPYDTICFQE